MGASITHSAARGVCGFPILANIDTDEQQQWATGWLEQVLTGEGLAPDPEERRELWRTVHMLADLPRHNAHAQYGPTVAPSDPAQGGTGPLLCGRRV